MEVEILTIVNQKYSEIEFLTTIIKMVDDIFYCNKALDIARSSKINGNLPFGCLLINNNGDILLEFENSVLTSKDSIAHCEINLIHSLAGLYSFEYLNNCTIYTSAEPCPMCSSAIFWSGIGKLIYAVSKKGYKKATNDNNSIFNLPVSSKKLLSKGGRKVIVKGPILEEEGMKFYQSLFNV